MTAGTQFDSGITRPASCKPYAVTVAELLIRMAATLRSVGCRCEHNVPYAGCKVPQIVTRECARCRCLREYEEISPPSESARIAQASAECRGNAAGGVP